MIEYLYTLQMMSSINLVNIYPPLHGTILMKLFSCVETFQDWFSYHFSSCDTVYLTTESCCTLHICDLLTFYNYNFITRNCYCWSQCYAVLSRSVVSNSETSWAVARQAPLSMGILQARILEWVSISFSSDGILHSHKKEWNHAICSIVDRPQEHYANWDKLHRERQVLCDSFCAWNLKKLNSGAESEIVVSRGREVRGMRRCWSKGTEFQL